MNIRISAAGRLTGSALRPWLLAAEGDAGSGAATQAEPSGSNPEPDAEPEAESKPGSKRIEVTQGELDRYKQERDEAKAVADKYEREKSEAARKAAEASGKWQELYESEKTKNAGLVAAAEQSKRADTIAGIAKRLNYRDPADAVRIAQIADDASASQIESALRLVAESKPYLLTTTPLATGGSTHKDPTPAPGPRTASQDLHDAYAAAEAK